MAARRLIAVLLVLLAVSVVAAALAPERDRPGLPSEDQTPTTTSPAGPPPTGELIRQAIAAEAAGPATLRAEPGDQLELSVTSTRFREIEIAPLGLLAPSTPDAPARFNVLLRDAGTIPITDADDGAVLGRILVGEDGVARDDERAEDSSEDAVSAGNA